MRCLAGVEDLYLRGALREVERHAVHLSGIEACDQRIQAGSARLGWHRRLRMVVQGYSDSPG